MYHIITRFIFRLYCNCYQQYIMIDIVFYVFISVIFYCVYVLYCTPLYPIVPYLTRSSPDLATVAPVWKGLGGYTTTLNNIVTHIKTVNKTTLWTIICNLYYIPSQNPIENVNYKAPDLESKQQFSEDSEWSTLRALKMP